VARAAPATWFVTPTGSDGNSCSDAAHPCATVNGAISKAAVGDTVEVASGTYVGSGDQVVLVDKGLTLEGGWNSSFSSQAGVSIVDGQSLRRGVKIQGATARIERFAVENGTKPANPEPFGGGGMLVDGPGASLVLDQSTVRDSQSTGIFSTGVLTIRNSTISGNVGSGIMIFGDPAPTELVVTNSTISGNSATNGAGILIEPLAVRPTIQLSNVTISGNSASASGGGIRLETIGAILHLRNSIVSGNTSSSAADADFSYFSGSTIVSEGYNIETNYPPAPHRHPHR
jgi:hypothetical protein